MLGILTNTKKQNIDQGLVNIIQIYTTKLWRNEGFLNMFLMTHWDGGLAVFA